MEPKIEPQGFVPKRPTNFQQHQRRIELLILEGMHDGKGWKPEAFPRYNELELLEHAPSSPAAPLSLSADQIKLMVERFLQWKLPENFNPDGGISFKKTFNDHTAHPMKHEPVGTNLFDFNQAEEMIRYVIEAGSPAAPTPHMNAAEFYREVWIKENGGDPRGDWPVRMAEAYAASETARADRAEQDISRNKPSGFKDLAEWKAQWEMLCESSVKETYKLIAAEADLQRKDAALTQADFFLSHSGNQRAIVGKSFEKPSGRWDEFQKTKKIVKDALAPVAAPEGTTPSPCCANPNLEAQGPCDHTQRLHPFTNDSFIGTCASWIHTHNVCLNCGKEEKI